MFTEDRIHYYYIFSLIRELSIISFIIIIILLMLGETHIIYMHNNDKCFDFIVSLLLLYY